MSNFWYTQAGQNNDTVVSTRIRLARNLKDFPFPRLLNHEQKIHVCECVRDTLLNNAAFASYHYIFMEDLTEIQAMAMVERHLISPEFATDRSGRALIINEEETVSIMLCEEDHIRLQAIMPGLDFEQAYSIADNIDNLLDETLSYAFDETLGYLTACPTNLGTGMRASVMLHLPALQESGAMQRIASGLSKIGLTIRGLYGEGSESKGCLYQLSNQVTLGLSEKSAIDNLKNISVQIIEQERNARAVLLKSEMIMDKISRSYGILKYATLLSSEEAMRYLSNVRLGASCSLLENIPPEKINRLMIITQPAMLLASGRKQLSQRECDSLRAEIIRSEL